MSTRFFGIFGSRRAAPRQAVAGLVLLGLVFFAATRPAMAAHHSTGHFLVLVRVVYQCRITAGFSARTQAVVMVMRHCPYQPQLHGAALADAKSRVLPGVFSTEYTLSRTTNRSTPGITYVNVVF